MDKKNQASHDSQRICFVFKAVLSPFGNEEVRTGEICSGLRDALYFETPLRNWGGLAGGRIATKPNEPDPLPASHL